MSDYAGLEATTELVAQLKAITGDKELLDTTDKSTLVAAINELYNSIFDNMTGNTWQAGIEVSSVVPSILKTKKGTILLIKSGETPSYSLDNGIIFRYASFPSGTFTSHECLELKNGTLVLAGSIGIVYSTDGGVHWYTSSCTSDGYTDLFETPTGRVFAVSSRADTHAIYSDDNGVTWRTPTDDIHGVATVASTSGTSYNAGKHTGITTLGNKLVVSSTEGIRFSTDDGDTWVGSNWTGTRPSYLVKTRNNVLLGFGGGLSGILYSTNAVQWNASDANGHFSMILETDSGNLVAGGNNLGGVSGIYYSTNNGTNWQNTNITTGYYHLIIKTQSGRLIACSATDNDIVYSDDNGVYWLSGGASGSCFSMLEITDSTLIACIGNYMRSTDNGATWHSGDTQVDLVDIIKGFDGRLLAPGSSDGKQSYPVWYSDEKYTPKWETAIEQLASQLNT